MKLHYEQTGPRHKDTPCLILLHGWAMHSGVMTPLADALSSHFQVISLDLPGHGFSEYEQNPSRKASILDRWSAAIFHTLDGLNLATTAYHWVGWSLGGRLALQLCKQHPKRCRSLVTIASNPQFVRDKDWPNGMTREDFEDFRRRVNENPQLALKRFLRLMVSGNMNSQTLLKRLKEDLDSRPIARTQSLNEGLQLLDNLGLIHSNQLVRLPWLALFATQDALVPDSATLATKTIATIGSNIGQGHAGWISEVHSTATTIRRFTQQHSTRLL